MPGDTEQGGRQGSSLTRAVGYFLAALGIVLMLVAGFCTLAIGGADVYSLPLLLGFGAVPLLLGIGLYVLGTRMIRR